MKKVEKILVLLVKKNTKAYSNGQHKFVESLKQYLPKTTVIDFSFYDDLIYSIADGNASIFDTKNGTDISKYDAVYFRYWRGASEQASACAVYLKTKGVTFYDKEVGSNNFKSRLTEYFRLWSKQVSIPDTLFCTIDTMDRAFKLNPRFEFPFIAKDISTSKGINNLLISSKSELKKSYVSNSESKFILQNFIENDGDYRVLVYGRSVAGVINRDLDKNEGIFNNNYQGKNSTLIDPSEFSEDFRRLAIKAATVFNRQIAGVDLIVDKKTGQAFVLEVNAKPQSYLGHFAEKRMQALAEYISKGRSIKVKQTINNFVQIDMPEVGITGLKSKVDTGAGISSIHATSFAVDPKTKILTFKLLDEEHPQYNNKPFSVKRYSIRKIRSSNGQEEKRYTVELPIIYNNTKYRVKFSLTNRKTMHNPVFLGRRFLKENNFIVSVK